VRISGYNWVVGRSAKEGEIQDVSIETTPEGLNRLQIARDARDLDPRFYVVDRRTLPNGAWRRLLEVHSFSRDALPDMLSEVRAIVNFETIPNSWGLTTEKTWGLPSGMESPWTEPIEMVGNELLLSTDTTWVSGDAPINIPVDNVYRNGKYVTYIRANGIYIEDVTGELIGVIGTNTNTVRWTEGIAGAATFNGGSVFIEPGKPPLFLGSFTLDHTPVPVQPGLYEYGDNYLISNIPLVGRSGVGAIAFIKDPHPQRWIRRMFGRAYVELVSPANVPPLIEDEPSRISVEAFPLRNDYDISPEVVTPYADKTGVFNTWDLDSPNVIYDPRERPYDVFLPFSKSIEDWGGHYVDHIGTFFPARDWRGELDASFPTAIRYELPDLPEMAEGVVFFRWKDSTSFNIIQTEWMRIFYKLGYIYFESKVSPEANGIQKIIVSTGWNKTKVEWNGSSLFVNDVPALTEEQTWGDVLGENNTWGEIANIAPSLWTPRGSIPLDVEQFAEIPPTWETGVPEGEVPPPVTDYSEAPRTWGRVLFEPYEEGI
jgi:hypothetical protein